MTEFEEIIKTASGQRNWEMMWSLLVRLIKISFIMIIRGSLWNPFISVPHRDIDSNYDIFRRKKYEEILVS